MYLEFYEYKYHLLNFVIFLKLLNFVIFLKRESLRLITGKA